MSMNFYHKLIFPVLLLLWPSCCYSDDNTNFYPFGLDLGDTLLICGTSEWASATLSSPLCLDDGSGNVHNLNSYLVSTNGIVSFDAEVSFYDNSYTYCPGFSGSDSFVSVFGIMTKTSGDFGFAQFREVTAPLDARVAEIIQAATGLLFTPSSAIVASWWEVNPYWNTSLSNSFQAVITTDGESKTFVIFMYKYIQWNQGKSGCSYWPTIGYWSNGRSRTFSQSCSGNTSYMAIRSNYGTNGIFVTWMGWEGSDPSIKSMADSSLTHIDMMGHRQLTLSGMADTFECSITTIRGASGFSYNYTVGGWVQNNCTDNIVQLPLGYFNSYGITNVTIFVQGPTGQEFGYAYMKLLVLLPDPKLTIEITHIDFSDYSVNLNAKWNTNATIVDYTGPIELSTTVFNASKRHYMEPVIVGSQDNSTGFLSLKLYAPLSIVLLTEHVIFKVHLLDELDSSENTLFSKMLVFSNDDEYFLQKFRNNFLKKITKIKLPETPVATIGMMGHRQLTIDYDAGAISSNLAMNCSFQHSQSPDQSAASKDSKHYTCYAPFFNTYGHIFGHLINSTGGTVKTFIVDVIPPYSEVEVEQTATFHDRTRKGGALLENERANNAIIEHLKNQNFLTMQDNNCSTFCPTDSDYSPEIGVELQFKWNSTSFPTSIHLVGIYMFALNVSTNAWNVPLKLTDSSNPIRADSNQAVVKLTKTDIMTFFRDTVMLGVGDSETSDGWMIFSKFFHH